MAQVFSSHFLWIFYLFYELKLFLRLEGEEALKRRCVCHPRAEKFNIVSNDHGRTQKCDFSDLGRKYPFWPYLVQKIKIVSLSWKLVPRLIRIC